SSCLSSVSIFFYPDTATTEIYTLSLHDALPIYVDHHTVGSFEFPVDLAAARALYAARLFQRGQRALEVVHVEADVVEALDRGRAFAQVGGVVAAVLQDGEVDVAVAQPDSIGAGTGGLPAQLFQPEDAL